MRSVLFRLINLLCVFDFFPPQNTGSHLCFRFICVETNFLDFAEFRGFVTLVGSKWEMGGRSFPAPFVTSCG